MMGNWDYSQPFKSKMVDKYDGMGIGIENAENVIADEEDARYDRGIALGDPETAPLRLVAFHKAESGASSFMLKCIYNEFSEETHDHKLLQWDHHQMQYKYEWEKEDGKPETLTSENLRISVFDITGFDNSQTKNDMNERIGQTMSYSNVILLMYSVTDKSSFDGDFSVKDIKLYLDQQLTKLGQRKIVILVATKCDLDAERKISVEQGQKLAAEWRVPFLEISNSKGTNMGQLVEKMCEIHKKAPGGTNYPPPPVNSGCCTIL